MPEIATINHVGVTVTDIERSTPWYTQVFGFTKLMEETHRDGTGYVLMLGKPDWSMCIGLHTHPTNPNEPFAETQTGLDHISFLVPSQSGAKRPIDSGGGHARVRDRPFPGSANPLVAESCICICICRCRASRLLKSAGVVNQSRDGSQLR
jgi:catechol 2,3-dioxygenase-like lactoylglutathione lyase family enzyme